MLAASRLDFLRLFPHLPVSGAPSARFGKMGHGTLALARRPAARTGQRKRPLDYADDQTATRRPQDDPSSDRCGKNQSATQRVDAPRRHARGLGETARPRRAPRNGGRQLSATPAVSRRQMGFLTCDSFHPPRPPSLPSVAPSSTPCGRFLVGFGVSRSGPIARKSITCAALGRHGARSISSDRVSLSLNRLLSIAGSESRNGQRLA